MIAALVLVALVAAGQTQAAPEYYSMDATQQLAITNPVEVWKQIQCVANHVPTIVSLVPETAEQLMNLSFNFSQAIGACGSADDKGKCVTEAFGSFKDGVYNVIQKDLPAKVQAITDSVNKCF